MSLWALVLAAIAGIAFILVSRRSAQTAPDDVGDPGLAIVEFGRAFPDEPVRGVVLTADGKSAFLRLADGKTGFMHSMGRHYVTHLVPPGSVEVEASAGERSLVVRFRECSFKGGTFVFAKTDEAAEVSVWLLGGFALAAEKAGDAQG